MDLTPIENTAAEIDEMYLNEDRPAARGGTLLEGTYELISRTLYTGPAGKTGPTGTKFKETALFKAIGPDLMYVKAAVSINGVEKKAFFTATVRGAELHVTMAGGATGSTAWGVDMYPTEMHVHADASGVPAIAVFKRK